MHAQRRESDPAFHINDDQLGVYDVICGRHKTAFDNIGNRRFRVLVALAQDKYASAPTRAHKTSVIRSIIDSVHNGGGRFLQRLGCSWVELDSKQTHGKVGHALRDMAIANKQKAKSSTQKIPLFPIHRKEESSEMKSCIVGMPDMPQSVGFMFPSEEKSIVTKCNILVDGYVFNYSGNKLNEEDQDNLKDAFVDDYVSMEIGFSELCHSCEYDRRASTISQNVLLCYNDRKFVV